MISCLSLFVPLYIGASGMQAQQNAVETIAHNLANMNTTGYKRRRVAQQDLLYVKRREVGSVTSTAAGTIDPSGNEVGLGVKTVGTYVINEQGVPLQTTHPYHLCIEGPGYFQIQMPDGSIAYTRDGSFDLNATSTIVTRDGLTVLPGITIPQNTLSVTINAEGEVMAKIDGQVALQNIGQFEIVTFPNNNGLNSIGNNLLLESPASGSPIVGAPKSPGFGGVLQSYIEGSNVNPVSEITDLISAQRAYEMNSKIIQAADQMMTTMSQGVR